MRGLAGQVRSFDRSVQLLMANQFTINLGFYMLMPFLAQYLAGTLGLAAWAVGLVLGVRNFSQQGMFLVGGALADRLGYKPLIVAGCTLRTVGFGVLAAVESLPALVVALAATGFAGALFNPAVRAYLAEDAGERRVEAFALFNVFYQAGILLGPLLGLALTWVDFRLTCLVSAAVFAVLTVLQVRALPARGATGEAAPGLDRSLWGQARVVLGNRAFLLFAAAMTGSYVLSFQVYLALPLEVRRLGGDGGVSTIGVGLLFAASGLVTIVGQTRVTAWCRRRLSAPAAVRVGLVVMGTAFVPLLAATAVPVPEGATGRAVLAVAPALAAAVLLAVGTMVAFPFEMDTIVALAGGRWVATHYGLYNTVVGVGITVGNLVTGAVLDAARAAQLSALPWAVLVLLGLVSAAAVRALDRGGRLTAATPTPA
ncbi:MFS transporter [Geodermatophilus sp. DSM 44513]|uniref:MFS transporter n=1 Tax=Geodermatophilus sp. DSM 44513 TaxID=1528104 RepID=UPI00127121D3|nr:MFS transporter [Geodermatophilus sp. DSM 44513]WNV77685.1 MFS transporter [Geodermatophilus sp. DSM 44513]